MTNKKAKNLFKFRLMVSKKKISMLKLNKRKILEKRQ